MTSESHRSNLGTYEERLRIESLGPHITRDMSEQFAEMIRESISSGVIDITNWTVDGVRALLQACSEGNLRVTLKYENRYFMLSFHIPPQSMDTVAQSILLGTL